MRPFPVLVAALTLVAGCGGAAAEPVTGTPGTPTTPTTPTTTAGAPAVRVRGASLVDGVGQALRLHGVNHSGTEYACAQGWGIFDGRVDSAAVAAVAAWKANVVRVPLNEHCWLGINTKPAYGGAAYQQAIADYVARLNKAGIVAILELHWSAPGTDSATKQAPMPDRDHTPEFWRQVAAAYKGNASVVFDLFNEPFPDGNQDTDEAWRCWRDGGTCRGTPYQVAGMQELVTAVRGTGATNVMLLGGVQYANALTQWLAYRPSDPANALAASWHVYDFNRCNNKACWDASAAPVAVQVPLVLGEIGDAYKGTTTEQPASRTSTFVGPLMDWMDAHGGNYLAWTWNVWNSPLDLVSDYDGTPTTYGQLFRAHFGG